MRNATLGVALERAAAIPLAIAEVGADVADLAASLAEHGNPAVRGDAVAGALLAEAGTRAAAHLVRINLGATPEDVRVDACGGGRGVPPRGRCSGRSATDE